MTRGRLLVLLGGLLLLVGLICSLGSTYYQVRAMGEARQGVAVLAPPKGSPEMLEKERHVHRSDWFFGLGLVLTAAGIILQTCGAIFPAPAAALPAAAPAAPVNPEVLWNAYELEVGLYRDYLGLILKGNAFYYLGVGAILSYYATKPERPLVWMPLLFLLLLGLALAVICFEAGRRSIVTRQHIIHLAGQLGLQAWPDAGILTALLYISTVLFVLAVLGIGAILWSITFY